MSTCPEVETLAAFVAGAASAAEILALAEHLQQCFDCRTVLDLVRRGSSAVPQTPQSKRRGQE